MSGVFCVRSLVGVVDRAGFIFSLAVEGPDVDNADLFVGSGYTMSVVGGLLDGPGARSFFLLMTDTLYMVIWRSAVSFLLRIGLFSQQSVDMSVVGFYDTHSGKGVNFSLCGMKKL